jgi:hypothetical protein
MIIDTINDYKTKLNCEEANLATLEKKLVEAEAHTDKIRYPIIGGVIGSFIINMFGHIILNPYVVILGLAIPLLMIPAYIVFFKREDKSSEIEKQIKVSKENIQKYENELERLNSRLEVQQLIDERSNYKKVEMPSLPIRINPYSKQNNKTR